MSLGPGKAGSHGGCRQGTQVRFPQAERVRHGAVVVSDVPAEVRRVVGVDRDVGG
jgi:hypothetical protein